MDQIAAFARKAEEIYSDLWHERFPSKFKRMYRDDVYAPLQSFFEEGTLKSVKEIDDKVIDRVIKWHVDDFEYLDDLPEDPEELEEYTQYLKEFTNKTQLLRQAMAIALNK